MNPPRINLSRFTSGQPVTDTNGSAPKVRLRAPASGGSRDARPKRGAGGLLAPLPAAGVVLVLIALVGYLGVYTASSKRTQVLFATRALPAGTIISAGDLRANGIAGEPSVLSALLPASETQQVIGQRLSSAVPAGAPVPAGALAGRQASASAFTLAVPEFDVTGEALQPGDRVTVLATFGAGSGAASTRPLARNLEVLSVGEVPPNAEPSTTTVPVAVALSEPSNASQLALADEDGKIDVLLEGSRASSGTIPQANQGSAP
jgi:Flp pilus assembly protein CpaB